MSIETPESHLISGETMTSAIQITRYYQAEALRLNSGVEEDKNILNAQKRLAWLNDRWVNEFVSKACIQNKVPYGLRHKQALDVAFNRSWLPHPHGGTCA
jgi:hypothetical protein